MPILPYKNNKSNLSRGEEIKVSRTFFPQKPICRPKNLRLYLRLLSLADE